MIESLSEIPTAETEKPQQGNKCLLKLMTPPKLLKSITVTGVESCYFISRVTSDHVWVSDRKNLILTNTTGDTLKHVEHLCSELEKLYIDLCGELHTVNSESELIYIDRKYNINKLSNDIKTTTTFIETPRLYMETTVCASTGDLLVEMYNNDTAEHI